MLIALAMFSLYFFWGSTYLAIRWAVQGYPPFCMAGLRNFSAGVILYAFVRLRGGPRPVLREWLTSTIIGGMLLLGGNGLVTFASKSLPSGLVAVLIAMLPLWMVILDRPRGADGARARINPVVLMGVVIGFCGVALLIAPKILAAISQLSENGSDVRMQGIAAACTVFSSLSWATGSLYSRRVGNSGGPRVLFRNTGMQLICGGTLLLLVSCAVEHPWTLTREAVFASPWPTISLVYLVVFGSLVGYSSYIWLLGVIPASRIATYAYVNPIVAIVLGWLVGGEKLTLRVLAAATIIVASVAVIVSSRGKSSAPPPEDG
jgi:drug/metabolite transporter (DMT)-like permease